jgi:hypothetical protein
MNVASMYRFQTMMVARDGFNLETLASHKKVNFLLILEAAMLVYSPKEYKTFKAAIDASFKDKEDK